MKRGFTLIELLVVVLIIGILSAIALPQYQKAVEKAKATQALTLLQSINTAYQSYILANGNRASKFSDLDISLPFNGNTKGYTIDSISDTLSNADWSIQIEYLDVPGYRYSNVFITRIRGKYAGAGFGISYGDLSGKIPTETAYCFERLQQGYTFTTGHQPGDYCVKLFNGTLLYDGAYHRTYSLPF